MAQVGDDLSSMIIPLAEMFPTDPLTYQVAKMDFEQRLAKAQAELKDYLRKGYTAVASGILAAPNGQSMYIILYKGEGEPVGLTMQGYERLFLQPVEGVG